ncbi:MAG: glycogen/starch synthase [bacterium]
MKVLFVGSECSPYIKTGGLADVLGSLPVTLSKQIECSVVIPYYKKIKEKNIGMYLGEKHFKFGEELIYAGVYYEKVNNVKYFFIDNNEFFYHDFLYGYNDDKRFTFFNMAVLECLDIMGEFNVLHLNDWHSGLIPFLIKYKYSVEIKTVFTIHNIQYQGIFNKGIHKFFKLYNDTLEFDNMINFMKCGIVNSNIITTVSTTYRNETLSYEFSYNLENILLSRKDDYYGIINGIDTNMYNPKTDNIIKPYSNYSEKNINKKEFCNEYNLNDNMLCSLISRLCDQKGIELLIDSIDHIMENSDVNLFLMGSGDMNYVEQLNYFAIKYPSRVKVYIGYNEELSHKVYASSDMLFVPSKFEPCGLTQLIAMRYGTIPLVRETGGLKDTVIPFNIHNKTGCGFTFKEFTSSSFKEVFNLAFQTYQNKEIWEVLSKNAMNNDFSFEASANEYLKIYNK